MDAGKYSMGIGDRFGHQGSAQLRAITEAGRKGVEITPVWNKSNREHVTIGTVPEDVRKEADSVTAEAGFRKSYFVDADHINFDTVDRFIPASDYFTIDVASFIGKKASAEKIGAFLSESKKYTGNLKIPGIEMPFSITPDFLRKTSENYLLATEKAGQIYRKIEAAKGGGKFITEISMDEVREPQRPADLFFILMMLGSEKIPVQTIAPKFSGRFNKGVDYEGDPVAFAREFEQDILVIDKAAREFGIPCDLKLSIHSGSDKFSIYPHIGAMAKKHNTGFHIKTAGTTWLEEVIGLASAGGEALEFVKEIYLSSLDNINELTSPYSNLINIKTELLPHGDKVKKWSGDEFASSIRHIPWNPSYNPSMRQLIHVAYKLAAVKKDEYYRLLEKHKEVVEESVFENLYNRHICRLFRIAD